MTTTFIEDIYKIFETLNSNTDVKSYIDIKIISKQYLAYYLYRIFCKYINLFENTIPSSEISNLLKILRIPNENKRENSCYPLARRMTNDGKYLDLIILSILDMLNKLGKYIASLPKADLYKNFLEFMEMKTLSVIVQDLVDLQKLVPGLSVPAIPP
jgi:hypothetical protein